MIAFETPVPLPLDSVCLHEAGHAVVARATWQTVLSCRVRKYRRNPDSLRGYIHVHAEPVGFIDYACTELAGNRAQHLFIPDHDTAHQRQWEYRSARTAIETGCAALGGDPVGAFERAVDRTDQILLRNADTVAAIKDELRSGRVLHGARLKSLLAHVPLLPRVGSHL